MTTIQDMSLDERCDVAESYTDLIRQRLLRLISWIVVMTPS